MHGEACEMILLKKGSINSRVQVRFDLAEQKQIVIKNKRTDLTVYSDKERVLTLTEFECALGRETLICKREKIDQI